MSDSGSRSARPEPVDDHRIDVSGRRVDAVIVGRATGTAITAFADVLTRLVEADEQFVVLFDRRRMTAPTAEGRQALEQWGETLTPRLSGRCLAWADIFDERRAASLARSGQSHEPGPYPQRTLTDPVEAAAWLDTVLSDADHTA